MNAFAEELYQQELIDRRCEVLENRLRDLKKSMQSLPPNGMEILIEMKQLHNELLELYSRV